MKKEVLVGPPDSEFLYDSHSWWINYMDQHCAVYDDGARLIGANGTFRLRSKSLHTSYIEFDTEEDATYFILKWS
jgi:hypothetical protein